MDAQTLAAQGSPTVADNSEAEISLSREQLVHLPELFGTSRLDLIEEQCRTLAQATASALLALGLRLIFLREVVDHGEWLPLLERIGINRAVAARTMRAAIRFHGLPHQERLLQAAKSKTKLLELMTLDDDELARLSQGEAVRGVSLTTLPQITVSTLRSTLKDNGPKSRVDAAFEESMEKARHELEQKDLLIRGRAWENRALTPDMGNASTSTHLPPDEGGWRLDSPVWGEDDSNGATSHLSANGALTHHFEDPADYPAVYALLPGEFNGGPISLIRHEGKSWLMASEVAAILATDGRELDEIQAVLDEWHRLGKPEGSLLKVRLASTSTVCLVIDKFALEMLHVRLNTPASAALSAWFDSPPALAEVTPLHEEPSKTTPGECLDQLRQQHRLLYLMLSKVNAQVRCMREIAIECPAKMPDLIPDLADVAIDIVDGWDDLIEDADTSLCSLRRTLKQADETAH